LGGEAEVGDFVKQITLQGIVSGGSGEPEGKNHLA